MSHTAAVALRCCLCGRQLWNPAVYIQNLPVGSTCAKRHELIALAQRGGQHLVKLPRAGAHNSRPKGDTHNNLELFPEEP